MSWNHGNSFIKCRSHVSSEVLDLILEIFRKDTPIHKILIAGKIDPNLNQWVSKSP